MAAGRIVRPLLMGLCLALTALGLNNTYGDATELEALAEQTACGSAHCSLRKLSEARSPFKQTFGFQTALVQKGKVDRSASVDVTCQRELVFLGEYRCAVSSGGLPEAR